MIRTMPLALLWLLAIATAHAARPTADELATARQWSSDHVLSSQPSPPFHFEFGGRSSHDWLRGCQSKFASTEIDAARRSHVRLWTDAKTGLQARLVATEYRDFPVIEWTVWLKNAGTQPTPPVRNLLGLDASFERLATGEFILHGIRGDSCRPDSFMPYALPLAPKAAKTFSPPCNGDKVSGKSSDGPDGWPYFNLQMPGGGLIVAVGWPGQWQASFARDSARSLRIQAGQQRTDLILRPGDEIRTPSITLLFWQGDDVFHAQNLWRSWYVEHVLPRIDGKPQPPITQIQVSGALSTWPGIQAYLDAGARPTVCWRDAGGVNTWFPTAGGPFGGKQPLWLNTGTWEVDPAKYPQGFKPFSDKARAAGMQFLLWFEPERVGDPNSWLGRNHPEWLMPGNSVGAVLNLGDPQALAWLTDHLDGLVKSQGLDWYREDLNGANYGTAWRRHDTPDRQGYTENRYVQGHLALWDELRRRNPHLRIDSCASGGRRNDLETMRRAVPLLRSDWSVSSFANEPLQIEGNQAQTYGLSAWLPWQGAGVPRFTDLYAARSYYLAGFGMCTGEGLPSDPVRRAGVVRGYTEAQRVAPLMLADYYPLTPYSLDTTSWIAWQFHSEQTDESLVQAFRRPQAEAASLTVKLHGFDPSRRYEIEDLDGPQQRLSGAELLRGYTITASQKPAAKVFLLKPVR